MLEKIARLEATIEKAEANHNCTQNREETAPSELGENREEYSRKFEEQSAQKCEECRSLSRALHAVKSGHIEGKSGGNLKYR